MNPRRAGSRSRARLCAYGAPVGCLASPATSLELKRAERSSSVQCRIEFPADWRSDEPRDHRHATPAPRVNNCVCQAAPILPWPIDLTTGSPKEDICPTMKKDPIAAQAPGISLRCNNCVPCCERHLIVSLLREGEFVKRGTVQFRGNSPATCNAASAT